MTDRVEVTNFPSPQTKEQTALELMKWHVDHHVQPLSKSEVINLYLECLAAVRAPE